VRRVLLLVGLVALAAASPGASADPLAGETCRTRSFLRFHGTLYFHHRLRVERPRLGPRRGVGLERPCDVPPGEDPPPWAPLTVYALDGIRTAVAVAPRRPRAVFYDPYRCSPRRGEIRFLRCLTRGGS
jgi:hypothetical protein